MLDLTMRRRQRKFREKEIPAAHGWVLEDGVGSNLAPTAPRDRVLLSPGKGGAYDLIGFKAPHGHLFAG